MSTRHAPLVNFSLRREIFFVTAGSIAGGIVMHLVIFALDLLGSASYLTTLLVAARVVGSPVPVAGLLLHLFVSTVIGIVTGIFLHRMIKFNISKIARGLAYGVTAGIVVFVVFAIPVYNILLVPNLAQVLMEFDPQMTFGEISDDINDGLPVTLLYSFLYHIIWGLTLGATSSLLTRRAGANYRCHICDIEFSRIRTYERHQTVHQDPPPAMKKILILGGGYAGVNVLNKIQKSFEGDISVDIRLVSESNFFLHTPMLPEMATGTIEPRHIATPIRKFCKRAKFHQARAVGIDLESRQVTIQRDSDGTRKNLRYDYLVLAMGGRTNFFGNKNIEEHAMTIKTLDDAIRLRNHVISALEDADQETDPAIQSRLVTFVIVGGGFSGVETAGELNDFIRESVEKFYRNIDPDMVKVVLVASGEKILPEIGSLGGYAKRSLQKAGVTILVNTRLADASPAGAVLSGGDEIPCGTLVWAGGVAVDAVIEKLDTEHHKGGRIMVDEHLRLKNHGEVYALGDCALVTDPRSGKPYPPTAQHAIRQAGTVSENLISAVCGRPVQSSFVYDAKGSMAKIGKKDGVALLMGHEFSGFFAWFVWKQYYLSTLPTNEKKIRVGLDWFVDLFFPKDITRLS